MNIDIKSVDIEAWVKEIYVLWELGLWNNIGPVYWTLYF
jgi:hypothetical protein